MNLVLLLTNFEAVPPKDVEGDSFLADADASDHILGFCHNNFLP